MAADVTAAAAAGATATEEDGISTTGDGVTLGEVSVEGTTTVSEEEIAAATEVTTEGATIGSDEGIGTSTEGVTTGAAVVFGTAATV